MAFLKPFDEDTQGQNSQQGQVPSSQNNPSLSQGSSTIVSTPGNVASSSTPGVRSAGNNGLPGTGALSGNWTNISDFLNANPSMGQTALNKANSYQTTEQGLYNAAAQPIRDSRIPENVYDVGPDVSYILNPDTSSKSKYGLQDVKDAYNYQFNFPLDVNYDPNSSGNLANERKLADRTTAPDVLASDAISKGQYGLGQRTLDTSLLGADPNYTQNSAQITSNINNYLNNTYGDMAQLHQGQVQDKNIADDIRNSVQGQVQNALTGTMGSLTDEFNKAMGQDKSTKQDYYNQYANWYNNTYLPVENKIDPVDPSTGVRYSKEPGIKPPTGKGAPSFTFQDLFQSQLSPYTDPTMSNVGTASQYGELANIANVLGNSPAYTQNGTYQLPTIGTAQWKQDYDAWINSPAGKAANEGSPYPVLSGPLTSEIDQQLGQLKSGNVQTPEDLAKALGLA